MRAALVPMLMLIGACHLAAGIEEATLISPDDICDADGDCDDQNGCTTDTCVEGVCENTPLDGPLEGQVAGDCQETRCEAGVSTTIADDADVPDDGSDCTLDGCADGTPTHDAVAGGTPCEGGVCNGDGTCTECFANVDCTSPDTCGGGGTPGVCGCTPVPCSMFGLTCGFAAENGCGAPLDCDNATIDGDETDVDCGGNVNTCAVRCPAGRMCDDGTDCASGSCNGGLCL